MEKNTVNLAGAILINKPVGATSHDIVRDIRRIVGGSVGHSGTLDPFATGLLIILIGHATRLQDELHMPAKTYEAEITLGENTTTDDITGEVLSFSPPYTRGSLPAGQAGERGSETERPHLASPHMRGGNPTIQEILAALEYIKQQTSQIPPQYAAIKVRGKKMYEYARAGESVERKPRPINIHNILLHEYAYPLLKISVTCSTGTYIRSIARDIGEFLGTGAYCSSLTRTAIGPFELKNAVSPEELPDNIAPALIPMQQLVSHLPSIICEEDNVVKYKQGKPVRQSVSDGGVGTSIQDIPMNTPIALLNKNKELFGIGIRETDERIVKPKKIFL